jgi:hypothetical protein
VPFAWDDAHELAEPGGLYVQWVVKTYDLGLIGTTWQEYDPILYAALDAMEAKYLPDPLLRSTPPRQVIIC